MGNRIYVGNISYTTDKAALQAAFEQGGRTVRDIYMPDDRDTGKPRGFAFIEMGSDAEAAAAIVEMDGADLDGRRLRVNEAQERERKGGGGGGGKGRSSGYGGKSHRQPNRGRGGDDYGDRW